MIQIKQFKLEFVTIRMIGKLIMHGFLNFRVTLVWFRGLDYNQFWFLYFVLGIKSEYLIFFFKWWYNKNKKLELPTEFPCWYVFAPLIQDILVLNFTNCLVWFVFCSFFDFHLIPFIFSIYFILFFILFHSLYFIICFTFLFPIISSLLGLKWRNIALGTEYHEWQCIIVGLRNPLWLNTHLHYLYSCQLTSIGIVNNEFPISKMIHIDDESDFVFHAEDNIFKITIHAFLRYFNSN